MDGTFKITLPYLRQLGACRYGQRAFQMAFPDGGGYQEVLDRCAEEGRLDFGEWLLEHIGPTNDVRNYEDVVSMPDKCIIFAGQLEFKSSVSVKYVISGKGIKAGGGIKSGEDIKAGDDVKAGCGLEAGCGIQAGGGIQAGEDFCVFAGLSVCKSDWSKFAIVTAKTKPINLMSGFWKPLEATDEKAP